MEDEFLRFLRKHGPRGPQAQRAIVLFSRSGEHAALWFVVGVVGLMASGDRDERAAWGRGVLATAVAYGLNTAVKYAVKRPRPALDDAPPLSPVVSRLSFPSAHATTSFAAAAAYSGALPSATPLLYGTAVAMAASRPYLGVHYPSDVLAGAALGTLIGRILKWR